MYRDQSHDLVVPLNPDARDLWIEWYNDLEKDMGGELAGKASIAARGR